MLEGERAEANERSRVVDDPAPGTNVWRSAKDSFVSGSALIPT